MKSNWNIKSGFVIIILALLFEGNGCRTTPDHTPADLNEGSAALSSLARQFARVSPRQLNRNINDEQLKRMNLSLAEVPMVAPAPFNTDQMQPRRTFLEPDTAAQTEPNDITVKDELAGPKAYLRARWLLKKAYGRLKQDYTKQALDELAAARKADPNQADLYQLTAEAQSHLGNNAAALAASEQAILRDPHSMAAYHIYGTIRFNQGRFDDATWALHRALQCPKALNSNPMTAQVHLLLARTLEESGFLNAAAEEFHQAWQLLFYQQGYSQTNPFTAQLVRNAHVSLLALAGLELQLGRIDQAVQLLQQARQAMALREDLIHVFITSLARQKISLHDRFQQVLAICRYLLVVSPHTETVLETFYETCLEMSKYNAFLEHIESWYRPTPPNPVLLRPRGYAYGLLLAEKFEQSEEVLTRLAAREPHKSISLDLARLYAQRRQWSRMILAYGDALAAAPDQQHTMAAVLSSLDRLRGRFSPDVEQLSQWAETPRLHTHPAGNFLLGHLAEGADQPDWAERFYRRALAADKPFAPARIRLVRILLEQKHFDQVLAIITRNGEDAQLLRYAGRACLGLEDWAQAGQYYRRLLELQQDDLEAYLALGEGWYCQNEFGRAEEILLQVLLNWPNRPVVDRQLLLLYARWNAQNGIGDQMQEATELRCLQMLRLWIRHTALPIREVRAGQFQWSRRRQIPRATVETRVIAPLEELAGEFPRGRAIGIMLSRLYALMDQGTKAVAQIEQLRNYYPEHERILILAAHLQEQYGNLEMAGLRWETLWRLKPLNSERMRECLRTMRLADRAQEALALLEEGLQQESWRRDLSVVQNLQLETQRLFVLTRYYDRAVDLFENWYGVLLDSDLIDREDPNEREPFCLAAENLIWALTQEGCLDRAALHTRALFQKSGPRTTRLGLWLVRTLHVRLEFDRARRLLDDLLRLHPDNITLWYLWMQTLIELDQPAAARERLEKWHLEKPEDKIRLRLLLSFFQEVEDYERAGDLLDRAEQVAVRDEAFELLRANLLTRAGRYDEAEQLVSRHQEGKKLSLDWLNARIKLDVARGKCDDLLQYLRRLVGGDRKDVSLLTLEGQILNSCGKSDEALALQEKIVTADPCNIEARLQYSLFLDKMERSDEALRQLEAALALQPDNAGLKNNLGYTLLEADRRGDRAGQLLRESLRAQPEAAPTLDSLGWYYYKKADFPAALDYIIQSAASLVAPDYEILDHLGDVEYRLKHVERARRYWQKALDQVEERSRTDQYLVEDKTRIERKLIQLDEGRTVKVAPLFDEKP